MRKAPEKACWNSCMSSLKNSASIWKWANPWSWKVRDGAAKIAALSASYSANPPAELDGVPVSGIRDFSKGDMVDVEGDPIPAEKMIFVDLADGRSFAVRPSGTEPKIKYYLFGHGKPGEPVKEALPKVQASLDSLWAARGKGCPHPVPTAKYC